MTESMWQAILLGLVQGFSEFLPISSSAHLILVNWVLGLKPLGLTFDVMVHVGTLLAILVCFFQDWKIIALRFLRFQLKSNPTDVPDVRLLAVATIPAALAGLFFKDGIEHHLRAPLPTAAVLAAFGLILWWADSTGSQSRPLSEIGYPAALAIGLAQALALAPGVSRSGVTITAALLLGYRRPDSARFSFLLAAPLIAGAAVAQGRAWWAGEDAQTLSLAVLLTGVAVSFLTGWLCIRVFLRYLRNGRLAPFARYRLIVAALIALIWWVR